MPKFLFLIPHPYKIIFSSQGQVAQHTNSVSAKVDVESNTGLALASNSFFGSLVNLEMNKYSIQVCLENNSALAENLDLGSSTEQVGALAIFVKDIEASTTQEFYAQKGKKDCKTFAGGSLELLPEVTMRDIIINGSVGPQQVQCHLVTPGESRVTIRTEFNLKTFAWNLLLVLLGIGVIIQISKAYADFIFRRSRGDLGT